MGEMSLKDIWTTQKLYGRTLDRVIELEQQGIFPLAMFYKMSEEFSKPADVILAVLEEELIRWSTVNHTPLTLAGKALAIHLAQEAGWIQPQKLDPQRGESLADLEAMSEKEFDEWISQLRNTGARVRRSS